MASCGKATFTRALGRCNVILTIRPATREDAVSIAPRLRPEDKQEIEIATGQSATEVVPLAFDTSTECYTVRLTDRHGRIEPDPSAIFGVAKDTETLGVLWMLASSEIVRAPMSILREAQHWVAEFHRRYPGGLHNLVWSENDLHLRWLRLLGFEEGKTLQLHGHTFIHVYRRTQEPCATLAQS